MNKIQPVLFLTLSSISFATLASPTIQSASMQSHEVDGVYQLSIEGSDFGQGPKVVYYNNFNHYDPGSDYINNLSEGLIEMDATTNIDETPRVMSYLGKEGYQVVDEPNDKYGILRVNLGGVYEEVFLSYSVAIPEGYTAPNATQPYEWKGSSWKLTWLLQEEESYKNGAQYDMCAPTQVGSSTYIAGNANHLKEIKSGYNTSVDKKSNWWKWDGFNHINFWTKDNPSNPEASPIHMSTLNDEFGLIDRDIDPTKIKFTGPRVKVGVINLPGWVRNTSEDNFQAIYDDIYIAVGEQARARVEITDSQVYQDSTMRIPVPPDNWTDTRIDLHVNKEDLDEAKDYYVHVFDASANKSSQGYKLESCPRCPKSPGGLTVDLL